MDEVYRFLSSTAFSFGASSFTVGQLLYAPLLLLVGAAFIAWSARFMRARLAGRNLNPDLIQVVSRAYLVVALVVLVISALELLNVPLTAFAFVSGAIAIGVGFGAQNIINNFISGWILMWERPIRIGDFLEIGTSQGNVEAINTRSTRIRRVDGVHMLIPNSHLLENMVTNWTLVDRLTRTTVRVGVSYGSPVIKVAELMQQVADEHPDVLKEPASAVLFEDFGDSALIFDLNVWIHATAERSLRKIRSDLRFSISAIFETHDIVIAFPQRDVHVDGALVIKQDAVKS